jgi:hypothetical protein
VGDCPEIVRRERVGYVFGEALSLDRVAAEIRANRATLRVRCREVAARHFDGDRYLVVYKELVTGVAQP